MPPATRVKSTLSSLETMDFGNIAVPLFVVTEAVSRQFDPPVESTTLPEASRKVNEKPFSVVNASSFVSDIVQLSVGVTSARTEVCGRYRKAVRAIRPGKGPRGSTARCTGGNLHRPVKIFQSKKGEICSQCRQVLSQRPRYHSDFPVASHKRTLWVAAVEPCFSRMMMLWLL